MIYELMYIIPSRYSDTEIEGITKKVSEVLAKSEAKVEKTSNLGKIKLAYPINKERFGTYILLYIEVEGEKIEKIDQDLRLTDELLRHILVKRPEGIPTQEFDLGAYEAPITSEGKRTHAKPRVKTQDAPRPKPATGEKLSMEELDKKLDSILDADLGDV
jgi:small subunit ribosomal protein S6